MIVRKDKVNLGRGLKDRNSRMKNFCQKKRNRLYQQQEHTENHLDMKKLHLNIKGNRAFATKSWDENVENLDFSEEPRSAESSNADCKSE